MDLDNDDDLSDREVAKRNWSLGEDRARSFRENGYSGYSAREAIPEGLGDGLEASIAYGIFGENDSPYQLDGHLPALDEYNPRIFRKAVTFQDGQSRYFTAGEFSEAYSAVAFANAHGAVLNVFVSVTWPLLGITDHEEMSRIFCHDLRKPMREWFEYRNPVEMPFAWLYVHEIGQTHGLHTHMLLAIPNEQRNEFRSWLRKRLAAISRTGVPPKGSHKVKAPPSDPIGRQWRWFQYLFKGVDPEAVLPSIVGPEPYTKVQSLVRFPAQSPGKLKCRRSMGVALAMRKAARKQAGFESLLDQGVLDHRVMYSGKEYLTYLRQQLPLKVDRD